MRRLILALAATAALGLSASAAAADDVEDFYKGNTVKIIVGVPPGSGYDLNARAVANYLGNYIPGHPSVVVQNQPGAASLTMTNLLYNVGPFDGTVIGAGTNGIPTAALLLDDAAKFDPLKMNWVGSTNSETHVAYVWNTAPVQNWDDLTKKELIVGAQAPGVTQYDYPLVANAFLGTKFKVISGYHGTPEIHTAMERGEVQGVGASGWTTLELLNADWLKQKKVKVIAQWDLRANPDLPDVPMVYNMAKTDEAKQALHLVLARLEAGRPFYLPPKVPEERVEAIRRAFDAVMKDKGYIAEIAKLKLEINPMTGEDVLKLEQDLMNTPSGVVEKVRAALKKQ